MLYEDEKDQLSWQHYVFAAATIITVPLYVLILWVILWRPKLTLFHVLMLSQGVADITFLLSYNFFVTFRLSMICYNFYWRYRYLLSNASFLHTYFSTYLRCIGITLISMQRYITVCRYGTKIDAMMTKTPFAVFVIFHWLSALLVTAPLLTSFDATFLPDMNADIPMDILALANLISVITVAVLFIVCAFCYVLVLLHMLQSKVSVNKTKQYEIRLSIQVAGLMIAFVLVFVYNVGQYIILQSGLNGFLATWRQFNPIMNGFLSCVQPWMCLFFNKDIQSKLKKIFGYRRRDAVARSSVFKSPTSVVPFVKR